MLSNSTGEHTATPPPRSGFSSSGAPNPNVRGSASTASRSRPRTALARRITLANGGALGGPALAHELQESHMFKVVIDGDDGGVRMRQVHERIEAAMRVRLRYHQPVVVQPGLEPETSPLPSRVSVAYHDGVFEVSGHDVCDFYAVPSWEQFAADVPKLRLTIGNANCIKACTHRLGIIQERSRMFFLLNTDIEERQNPRKAGGVFADVTKVDTAVRLSRCCDAQELLDYVVDSCVRTPNAPVQLLDGRSCTLRELLQAYGVFDAAQLTVEGLDWQPRAGKEGVVGLREHTDLAGLGAALRYTFTSWRGSLSAPFLRRQMEKLERSTQAAEYSIPVYAAYEEEVRDIAKAFSVMGAPCHERSRLVLQLRLHKPPEGYPTECKTFQDQLGFFFLPLLRATISPETERATAALLERVGAIHVESLFDAPEKDFNPNAESPEQSPADGTASALYYFYYIYANLMVLNSLRRRSGMNTFQLRGSGGQRSGMDDLVAAYMLADVITMSTKLMHHPVLQYLCGLHAIGLTASPLTDHQVGVVAYQDHPLPNFLHRCLRVSISTESPLSFHHSPNALAEEYATAQKIFRLSPLDVTEMARNSVAFSSFPATTREAWLGERYHLGLAGNDFERSQVTNVRLAFRAETWTLERNMMRDLHLSRAAGSGDGLGRWHHLSNVQEVEYNTVMDSRIRFPRTVLNGPHREVKSAVVAAPRVARALALRDKYIWRPPNPWETNRRRDVEADFQRKTDTFNEDEWTYTASDAVFLSFPRNAIHAWPRTLPTIEDFHRDLIELKAICSSAEVKDFAHKRLENLEHKFRLHLALNHANEAGTTEERVSSNRDIYQATKVDTHIHMAAGMTPKQILEFVLQKLQDNADDIAMKKGDEILTLGQLFTRAGITTSLTVDQLNVQADHTLFERFDNFNNKYNPMENGDLRSLMLKTDNFMNGRYFAELIHMVFAQYSRDRYTYAENRVSVYGISLKEWEKLANWFATHGMASKHNKWIIQVPRVYKVFRAQNVIGSFGQYLENIFQPLWEASLHPSEHPTLHNFLNHVSGFDSVDNEATIDLPFSPVSPWAWTSVENPPYNYYLYYLYANIRSLNEFRASRGFSTFATRPHCGEAGSDEHLYGAFLCANSICHGINLRNDPPMQYLYYLTQIGLHVSPLSNNALFLRFLNNPFPEFFRRGLNVSLSTDDPMMFHQTQEPLIEEYSIAARVWGLSPNDLCEIARNSVLQCGFDYSFKREAIGDRWYMSSSLGNDPLRTHLSDIRVAFRFETYHTEMQNLELCAGHPVVRFMLTADEEREINEHNLDVGPEEIILSTHDQAMEVMLRAIDGNREKIRVAKAQVDALRRQQRSLVENITEAGMRRQAEEEKERAELAQKQLRYVRKDLVTAMPQRPPFETAESMTVRRMLHWRPMPPNALRTVTETNFAVDGPHRPLPPLRRTI